MLRQFLIYLIMSILVVVFARYAHILVVYIAMLFTFLKVKLGPVFSQNGWGLIVRNIIILVILPLILSSIPALSYRLFKGKGREMPHFLILTWIFWIIIVFSILLVR